MKSNVKIVLKACIGIHIGIAFLMICYIFLYVLAGEEVFKNAILEFSHVSTLIKQLLIMSITGYSVLLGIYLYPYINDIVNKTNNVSRIIFPFAVLVVFIFLFPCGLILYTNAFPDTLLSIIETTWITVLVIMCISIIAYQVIIQSRINRKIKEKNNI